MNGGFFLNRFFIILFVFEYMKNNKFVLKVRLREFLWKLWK